MYPNTFIYRNLLTSAADELAPEDQLFSKNTASSAHVPDSFPDDSLLLEATDERGLSWKAFKEWITGSAHVSGRFSYDSWSLGVLSQVSPISRFKSLWNDWDCSDLDYFDPGNGQD